jgi:hypothetical protein
MPAVPSIVINENIAFDNIPDMQALSEAVRKIIHSYGYNFTADGR